MMSGKENHYHKVKEITNVEIPQGKRRAQIITVLSTIPINERFTNRTIREDRRILAKFPGIPRTRMKKIFQESIFYGKKLGVFEQIHLEPIQFLDFIEDPFIKHWLNDIRGSKYKHPEVSPLRNLPIGSTQYTYANYLWHFNNWLHGREIVVTQKIPLEAGVFREQKTSIKLEGVTHFVQSYRDFGKDSHEFALLVKDYLNDPQHENLGIKAMGNKKNAILSIFDSYQLHLPLVYNINKKFKKTSREVLSQKILSINDLTLCLTKGRPTKLECAVVMCMFHRGLDRSSMSDRFNYEAWDQLVAAFGTDNFELWDLAKCPVPIRLERMKTDYSHVGFLDRDAVVCIQNYLRDERIPKFGEVQEGQPIFYTSKGNPISAAWVGSVLPKLASVSGIQKTVSGYENIVAHSITSHEVRDTLDSIMSDAGSKFFAVCESIGHVTKDSYNKAPAMFEDSLRSEFVKASSKINIFSKMASFVQDSDSIDKLTEKNSQLEIENYKMREEYRALTKEIENYRQQTSEMLDVPQMDLLREQIQDEIERRLAGRLPPKPAQVDKN